MRSNSESLRDEVLDRDRDAFDCTPVTKPTAIRALRYGSSE